MIAVFWNQRNGEEHIKNCFDLDSAEKVDSNHWAYFIPYRFEACTPHPRGSFLHFIWGGEHFFLLEKHTESLWVKLTTEIKIGPLNSCCRSDQNKMSIIVFARMIKRILLEHTWAKKKIETLQWSPHTEWTSNKLILCYVGGGGLATA